MPANKEVLENYLELIQETRKKVADWLDYDTNCIDMTRDDDIIARYMVDQGTPDRMPLLEDLLHDLDETIENVKRHINANE